jgi:16S rRNA (uracil1498-N3)-methyltransferase
MHARFFAPDLASGGPVVRLPPEEAEHLVRVLRLGVGAVVQVFDGRGREFLARVESTGRQEVVVTALDPVASAPEPAVALTLAQAVLKGDRMDDVVRDAAMLGVTAVQPIISERTEIQAAHRPRASRTERWHRVAVASVKQCGRAVVPEVRIPLRLDDYLRVEVAACRVLLVEPRAGGPAPRPFSVREPEATPASAALLIGPEGGWTDEEMRAAGRHNFQRLTLGSRTLRADATPVAAIAVLQFLWGDL